MKNLIFLLFLLIILAGCSQKYQKTESADSWELVWSDEFNSNGLPDSAKWDYDVDGHGWGNNEKQYYTKARPENARVENGRLIIEARKEKLDSSDYTSARLVTRGKAEWTYGRFEIRAKLPSGTGTWPAIWMLPVKQSYGESYWPDNGEIDIMEHVGFNPGFIHASAHSLKYYWRIGTQRTDTIHSTDVMENFHTYTLEWNPDSITMSFDSTRYFTSRNDKTDWQAWPFDKSFYLIMNIAVGGDWGGQKGIDDTIWPQRMEVEFVRIYRKSE